MRTKARQGDQLEVPAMIQVTEVNSLDQVGARETGDKLSNSVYNFTFGIYLLLYQVFS